MPSFLLRELGEEQTGCIDVNGAWSCGIQSLRKARFKNVAIPVELGNKGREMQFRSTCTETQN